MTRRARRGAEKGEPVPGRQRSDGSCTGADVADLAGRQVRIEVLDADTGGWGHVLADGPTSSAEPALPRSDGTTVHLLVDGETVRTATGSNSETLDWVAWDVRDLVGRPARVRVVDRNSGGFGHVLVAHVMASDEPASSSPERYQWLDHGKDFSAALTSEHLPGNRRIAIGWMNTWEHPAGTPTGTWRRSMVLPRELSLREVDGEVRLVQQPLEKATVLRGHQRDYELHDKTVVEGVTTLPVESRSQEGSPRGSGRTTCWSRSSGWSSAAAGRPRGQGNAGDRCPSVRGVPLHHVGSGHPQEVRC